MSFYLICDSFQTDDKLMSIYCILRNIKQLVVSLGMKIDFNYLMRMFVGETVIKALQTQSLLSVATNRQLFSVGIWKSAKVYRFWYVMSKVDRWHTASIFLTMYLKTNPERVSGDCLKSPIELRFTSSKTTLTRQKKKQR